MDLLRERLRNQRLIPPVGLSAAETVRWMGAVQAQATERYTAASNESAPTS